MCKKLIIPCFIMLLVFAGSVLADPSTYSAGIVLRADVEGQDEGDVGTTQAGWTRIKEFWNVDVGGMGLSVKVESHVSVATEGRTDGGAPTGPKADVGRDLIFGNDTASPPDNDMILTFRNLKPGYHRILSYHVRTDEADVPCPGFGLSGDDLVSVLSTPGAFIQDYNIMTIPAETIFNASGDGGDVIIRIKGPSESGGVGGESGQAYLNGFILEYFGASNKAPYNPSPANRAENLCTDAVSPLTWTPGSGVVSQDIYFSSDINDVDPCESPSPTATIGGTGSWATPALSGGVTYYWRVDGGGVQGAIWKFTTNAGQAYNPAPGNGWRGLATDVDLSWSPGCGSTAQDVYFGTAASPPLVNAGQAGTTYDLPLLTANTKYYWKIVSQTGGEISPIWSFKTGSGLEQMLLHFSFDGGSIGNPLAATIYDDENSEPFIKEDVNSHSAAVNYGDSAIWGTVDSGTSADFIPVGGYYRDGKAIGTDPLVLDGYQYTIECWVNPDVISDPGGDEARNRGHILFSMSGPGDSDIVDDGDEGPDTVWGLELSEPAGAIFVHKGTEYDRQNMQIYSGRGTVRTGEWTHIAAVWDMSAAESAKIYVNGQLMASAPKPYANRPDTNNVPIGIGFLKTYITDHNGLAFEGMLDEIKVHNYALEASEFGLVPGPEWASGPDPANNERRVDPNADLSWSAGSEATSHDVYFGTAFDDVKNANTNSSEFKGNQGVGDEDFEPGTMEFGTSYYWRIDELGGGGPYSGMIWKFTVQSVVDDPNRLLWYPLDETSGNEAEDASGHDAVGSVDNDNWDPNDGELGCLIFDDDNAILVPSVALDGIYDAISIAVWLKDSSRPGENNWLYDTAGSTIDVQIAVADQNGLVYWRAGNDTDDVLTWDPIKENIDLDDLQDWHHWAFTKSEKGSEMKIYFDGEVVESNGVVAETLDFIRGSSSRIGAAGGAGSDLVAKVDDFIIFDYALDDSGVAILYRRGDVTKAWKPNPRNAAAEVIRDANLGWNPGDYAVSHDVYFGTDFDDVNDATTASSAFKVNQVGTTYDPCNLVLGNTYYWRIDEVNVPNLDSPWKGKTWSFTVANYLIIDDFESYDPFDNLIYEHWNPLNTGAYYVGLGTDPFQPVRRGGRSMEYIYNNHDTLADGYWSEDYLTFDGPQDWESTGVKMVTLFFYGMPDNDANDSELMYVALEDSTTKTKVSYAGDMNDIKVSEWQEWNIQLSDFTDVDMNSVEMIYIGFGDDEAVLPGGDGVVYIDDIRLYPPKCVDACGPAYDFSGDCLVGFAEIAMMGDEWLLRDFQISPIVAPSASVLHYEFDESSGTTVFDTAGDPQGPYDGDFFDDVNQTPGDITDYMDACSVSGNSFHFWHSENDANLGGIMIDPTLFTDNGISQDISVAVWIKNVHTNETPDGDAFMWEFREWVGSPDANDRVLAVSTSDDGDTFNFMDSSESVSYEQDWGDHTEWTHYSFVRDADNLMIYVNGLLEEISDSNGTAMATPDLLYLGLSADRALNNNDGLHDGFTGNMDDFQIFDYALSDAQAGYLGTGGTGYVSMPSATMNLINDEEDGEKAVNFRDYAELMLYWLDEQLWPL